MKSSLKNSPVEGSGFISTFGTSDLKKSKKLLIFSSVVVQSDFIVARTSIVTSRRCTARATLAANATNTSSEEQRWPGTKDHMTKTRRSGKK